jgi:hypothetical protein
MKRIRNRIKKAIKIAESTDYLGYRISRIEELKRNHEENKEFLQEVLNRPIKIRVTSNCIVSILGTLLKVPTEIVEKAKYVILRYV